MLSLSRSLCVPLRGFISVMDPTAHTIFPYIRMTVRITLTSTPPLVQLDVIIDEYFDDLGVAYRAELKELYELGCRKSGSSCSPFLRIQS